LKNLFSGSRVGGVKFRTPKNSKPIPVLLDEALRFRIAAASEKMGEPQSTVMRISMRIGLEQLEDLFAKKPLAEILSSLQRETPAADPVEHTAARAAAAALNEAAGAPTPPPIPTAGQTAPAHYGKARRKRAR
jgi:hypothetical protein